MINRVERSGIRCRQVRKSAFAGAIAVATSCIALPLAFGQPLPDVLYHLTMADYADKNCPRYEAIRDAFSKELHDAGVTPESFGSKEFDGELRRQTDRFYVELDRVKVLETQTGVCRLFWNEIGKDGTSIHQLLKER
jgi:hypothetical protein